MDRTTHYKIGDVFDEMKHRASEGCHGEHETTCLDAEDERHPEDWCNRCLMSAAVKDREALRAKLETADQEIAKLTAWQPIETLPRDGKQLIVLFANGGYDVIASHREYDELISYGEPPALGWIRVPLKGHADKAPKET